MVSKLRAEHLRGGCGFSTTGVCGVTSRKGRTWALHTVWEANYLIFSFPCSYWKLRARKRKAICLSLWSAFVEVPGGNQGFPSAVLGPSGFHAFLAGDSAHEAAAKSCCWGLTEHRDREGGPQATENPRHWQSPSLGRTSEAQKPADFLGGHGLTGLTQIWPNQMPVYRLQSESGMGLGGRREAVCIFHIELLQGKDHVFEILHFSTNEW